MCYYPKNWYMLAWEDRQAITWRRGMITPAARRMLDHDARDAALMYALSRTRRDEAGRLVRAFIATPPALHVSYELLLSDLPQACIDDCSAMGPVDAAVAYWRRELGFTVNRERAIAYLRGFGAWEDDELAAMPDDDIAEKILWLACGNFHDYQVCGSHAGSDVLVLEE